MRSTSLLVCLGFASVASAQTQIRPRVLLMIDTSGSMTDHLTDNCSTYGDGSNGFKDAQLNEPTWYRGLPGFSLGGGGSCNNDCSQTNYDGVNSRMFNAKAAVTNVLNATGDIDWGLESYAGSFCTPSATPVVQDGCRPGTCPGSSTCSCNTKNCNGHCVCATDADCGGDYCNAGRCVTDSNLCQGMSFTGGGYDDFTNNGGTCTLIGQNGTWGGTCGAGGTAGTGACGTVQTCYSMSDCSGGACTALTGSAASAGACSGNGQCPTAWSCNGGRCIFQGGCQSDGGFIVVDPSTANSTNLIFPYINDFEDYTPKVTTQVPAVVDPELRANGLTPLAGAARTATAWYSAIKTANSDSKIACRPYVLVQITDGFDTCDGDANNGPVAAAQGFVAATAAGAKNLNKVYIIGLAFGGASNTVLDKIAAAGGTNNARYANTQQDIQAALSDIVSSSVLVEKCNNADDDCDGVCDEPFPDVALSGACGTRAAKSCNNGAIAGTKCFATGVYVCSSDQLSEVCSAPTCATMASLCPTAETCNGVDDDCNGVVDDCTPFVKGSCCTSCLNPQPEVCNGKDDDCDGTIDDNLTDTGIACGSSVGICTPGTTTCCTAAGGACTQVAMNGSNSTAGDTLRCIGGVQPAAEVCNGLDDNCNGLTDEGAGMSCYDLMGTAGVGICKAGTEACTAMSIAPGSGGCPPTGYMMSGKNCPGGAMYGACMGEVGPSPEVCNGIDDNCNGLVDDMVTDSWAGMPCCPTGNLADCMGTGGACAPGAYACVGGVKTCVGGVAKMTEVCNGLDDDCNGIVDDVAGLNANCTTGGVLTAGPCKAQYECAKNGAGMVVAGPGPNGLTCVQTVGPTTELCNGIDDDCDGVIDDHLNDPRVGVKGGTPCVPLTPLAGTTFPAGGPAPPCDPGTTACKNGMVVCTGEVFPMPNQCNGISTDCTGMVNTNGNCPSGFMCFMGNCVLPCSGGEFPCPGGFVCDNSQSPPLCVPDQCQMLNCPTGQLCQLDPKTGKFGCIDPCTKVTCPTGTICKQGVCTDSSCKTQGCPTGQVCVGTPPMCQTDPCAGVTCPSGQFCDSSTGTCQSACSPACPTGQDCVNGKCVSNGCNGVHCDPGFTCVVSNDGSTGMCVVNMCGSGCLSGQVCCKAACNADPCASQNCLAGETCTVDPSDCHANCTAAPAKPPDNVVGEGGGGVACAMAGASGRPDALVLLALLVLALFVRRRFA